MQKTNLKQGRRGVSDVAVADLAVVKDGRQLVVNGEQVLASLVGDVIHLQVSHIRLRSDADRLKQHEEILNMFNFIQIVLK